MDEQSKTRREVIGLLAASSGAALLGWGAPELPGRQKGKTAPPKKEEKKEEEVSPAEDLMREHGVLNRLLLVYEEGLRRLEGHKDLPPETLGGAARIIREFIEDYHEKLEETYLFPRFEKAGRHVQLVRVLRAQHQAGRGLTAQIELLANSTAFKNADDSRRLGAALRDFVRMYRPHEAREDTVLFPAFREIVTPQEYGALGEQFEDQEHDLFGEDGFERMVDEVAKLEETLGIYDLALFTPGARKPS